MCRETPPSDPTHHVYGSNCKQRNINGAGPKPFGNRARHSEHLEPKPYIIEIVQGSRRESKTFQNRHHLSRGQPKTQALRTHTKPRQNYPCRNHQKTIKNTNSIHLCTVWKILEPQTASTDFALKPKPLRTDEPSRIEDVLNRHRSEPNVV